ncbi:RrF2 family transcriptional regulator [Loigolactobacillus binensis]|uniref:RrF2 family transcriptional regulator n=1 Tax=Loigolactobacillus binensis TaxID=2559922 RepID=A0ABW3ECR6_9LACO|nr:Rrf2 family transcriptional regulator [Loigolactobacillus binensis]
MRFSTRFPIAVHTVMIIAALSNDRKINSDIISESMGVNAVTIRNVFKSLKQANMILVSPGPGGTTLARRPDDITLWEIFSAVEPIDTNDIFRFNKQPDEHSKIGGNIYGILRTHLDDGINALEEELSKVTISMMVDELRERMPDLPPLPDND